MLKRKAKFIGHFFIFYAYMKIADQLKLIVSSTLDVIYPNLCATCSDNLKSNENFLCLNCLYDLPYILNDESNQLKLKQLFWGREDVENIYSLLSYQKGNQVQDILHLIKYKQKTHFAKYLGRKLGDIITKEACRFDMILPVPLHPKKLKKRGFNQSVLLANGINEVLDVPITEKSIQRIRHNPTQTSIDKYDRWDNVRDVFAVSTPKKLINKHVLLVDDVLTTGATVEACLKQLLKIDNCKVSVATLAARI